MNSIGLQKHGLSTRAHVVRLDTNYRALCICRCLKCLGSIGTDLRMPLSTTTTLRLVWTLRNLSTTSIIASAAVATAGGCSFFFFGCGHDLNFLPLLRLQILMRVELQRLASNEAKSKLFIHEGSSQNYLRERKWKLLFMV